MESDEAADLLRHIRATLREQGFADLDRRVLDADEMWDREPSERVLAYLSALREEVRLGTEDASRTLMERFSEVRTPEGEAITGIEIEVVEQDVDTYGVDRVALVGSPALDRWMVALDEYIAQVRASGAA